MFADPVDRGIQVKSALKILKGWEYQTFLLCHFSWRANSTLEREDGDNYSRGRLIFEGPIELFWDPNAYLSRNKGLISWDKIQIDPEEEKYGIMELVLRTPQGDFEDVIEDVEFQSPKKEE